MSKLTIDFYQYKRNIRGQFYQNLYSFMLMKSFRIILPTQFCL